MMKKKPMTAKNFPAKKFRIFVLLMLTVFLSAACSSKLIRGAAPLVRMNELGHQDNSFEVQLSIRNLNGVPLNIEKIDFGLSVDDANLFTYEGAVNTNITANGTETLVLEIKADEIGIELLESLQNGDVTSLPYLLKGSVTSRDDGTLRFAHEGHLYPLPGRPGRFR
jgi:LEA14-like dessication related protein